MLFHSIGQSVGSGLWHPLEALLHMFVCHGVHVEREVSQAARCMAVMECDGFEESNLFKCLLSLLSSLKQLKELKYEGQH